ncbi:MAG: hypothetical protein ACOZAR_03245 [Patescibacteria group bacterium]
MKNAQNKRFGLILRTFATKPDDVIKRVEQVIETIKKAEKLNLEQGDRSFFSRIDVLVWADDRFDDADCGLTTRTLRDALYKQKKVFVSEVKNGDLYCTLLNYGIAKQLRDRVDYSFIMSSEAESYLNQETIERILQAIDDKARAIGVEVDELAPFVQEGRLANTFCCWHNVSLMSIGGFDLHAAKLPPNKGNEENTSPQHAYVEGHHEKHGKVFYQLAGTEEIIPLVRLVEIYGKCLASVSPAGEGLKKYQIPDPKTDSKLYLRHIAKMATKLKRQAAMLDSVNKKPSLLKNGLIDSTL